MYYGESPLLCWLGLHSASSVHRDEPLFQLNGGTPCRESPLLPGSRWRRRHRPLVWQASQCGGRLCPSPRQQRWPPLIGHLHWESPGCLRRHPLSPCLAPSPLRGWQHHQSGPWRCGLTLRLLISHYGRLSGLLDDNVGGILSLRLLQTQELL